MVIGPRFQVSIMLENAAEVSFRQQTTDFPHNGQKLSDYASNHTSNSSRRQNTFRIPFLPDSVNN